VLQRAADKLSPARTRRTALAKGRPARQL
jgi:hypothetical protein